MTFDMFLMEASSMSVVDFERQVFEGTIDSVIFFFYSSQIFFSLYAP